jgi:valyl-tRNA synthetase
MNSDVDVNSEIQKINDDIKYLKGFLFSVEKKLSNDSFSKNAPKSVIEIELKKQKDSIHKIKALEKRLNALKV